MTPSEQIAKLAQSAYLAVTGNYNDVEGEELTDFLNKTIDWTNQYTAELEMETDWNYLRQNSFNLGTVNTVGQESLEMPDEVRKLIASPYRDLILSQDGAIVARFKVVMPNQISDGVNYDTMDRCTVVNRSIIFGRPLTENEVGATILADVMFKMPELTITDTELLETITPYQLLILGTAKNISLPDLVRGGTSPSFVQKYNDLLQRAIAENNQSAEAMYADRESLSFVSGVW